MDKRGTTEDRRGGAAAPEHWAHLDGLRAVAVYLVVAFHAGVDRAAGGFIGVDVFFVLSGYLVTTVLMRDVAGTGTVRFRRFYARRVRRLLPAAGVNLVVTALVFRAISTPAELASARGSMRAASLYVSNWWFIRESADYFGSNIAASPVAHYWSLSVEEQFYVLWPVLLGGLVALARRLGRSRRAVLVACVAVAGSASLAAALLTAAHDPNRAYFGTDTRAYQLLAGAVLALAPSLAARISRLRHARWVVPRAAAVLLVGLVGSASGWIAVGPVTRGVLATVATAGLIVTLGASQGGLARRVLSAGPVTYLGRISYGTYLWHWIVILVAVRELDMAPLTTAAVAAPVATGLAALSYELLEHPIRVAPSLDRARVAVIACGLAASVLVGLVAVPGLLDLHPRTATAAAATPLTTEGTPISVDWRAAARDVPELEPCDMARNPVCRITSGSGPRILLVGDSHAAMLEPIFEQLATHHDLTLATAYLTYCPWVRGIKYPVFSERCFADQDDLYSRRIPAFDPDLVVLVHRPVDDVNDPLQAVLDAADGVASAQARAAEVAARVRATVGELRRAGRKLVIVEPIPVARGADAPLACLSKATFVEACRFITTTTPRPEERVFRALDADDRGVWSLDLDRAVCPYLPICDPIVDGHVVMYDNSHLTRGFAATLGPVVDRFFVANGILSG